MTNEQLQSITQTAEGVINILAPVVAAAVPAAAPAVADLGAAETVANAVEANLDHHTAVSDIATGVAALAATPAVASNPEAAKAVTGFALLLQDLVKIFTGGK